ncbi:MAG: homocysteine S-methyltransferase family protein [Candidatus Omnitrophica bacterium]|nr:homocysteine S-methyltransferase family protein [Candidatus Omnitrophota bacterium]
MKILNKSKKTNDRDIKKLIKRKLLILDGATGTQLQKLGMPQGVCPEIWAMENPQFIQAVHKNYAASGADIVYTCTFGANQIKLEQYGEPDVYKVNKTLADLARKAVPENVLVAGDIGPTGKFVAPFGPLEFEEAVNIFKQQIKGLLAGGVDLFVIETMMDIQEARAALLAARELSDKFTIVTMTYENDARTLNGTDPVSALITLQSLGADAVGSNCSCGPKQMLEIIKAMKPYAKVPLVAKPNAGMPQLIDGQTVFSMQAKEFAGFAAKFSANGVSFLGGCCGTTPEHIQALKTRIIKNKIKPTACSRKSISAVSSARSHLLLDLGKSFSIVGECINPTGKKSLQEELRAGKMSLVRGLAKQQQAQAAKMLDVNAGVVGIDEKKTLSQMINLLSVNSELPLVIDSSTVEVIENALRLYPGRALINSISAEQHKLDKLLPIAAKYGAMFILLPLNDREVPEKFTRRKQIALEIFKQAQKYGFTKEDVVIDGLCMTISSHPGAGIETMKTIEWAAKVFKANSICGLSNISFGMPRRLRINSTFMAILRKKGMSMVISNPLHETEKYNKQAENVLLAKDKHAAKYIKYCQDIELKLKGLPPKLKTSESLSPEKKVANAILEGNKEEIKDLAKAAVAAGIKPEDLVRKIMIPAINQVGDLFDKKQFFLPQLIASAQTMKTGFEYLEPLLKKGQAETAKKNIIILATVKGDIHDIGKNIVALLLKNHGFSVIDLGKDVSSEKIIEQIKKHKNPIVGLSALMTTTMVNMKQVIDLAKEQGLDCRFILGGAVITRAYADSLGAAYAGDGVEAVRVAKSLSK